MIPCVLCSDKNNNSLVTHPIFKCDKYVDPGAKYERLKELQACTRCAGAHQTEKCNFKFKSSCSKCNGWHFQFLCVRSASSRPKNKLDRVPESDKVNSALVNVQVKSICTDGALLPTFSGYFEDKIFVRALKDSGSHSNFISAHLAEDFGLKIVRQDIKLNICGFNNDKEYITNIVEFKLKLGEKCYFIDAICVPSIDIQVKVGDLGNLVGKFQSLGYSLADKFLNKDSDVVNRIDLIIGTDSSHCFKEFSEFYGGPVPSVYYQTGFGIMPVGNVSRALDNIESLQPFKAQSGSLSTGTVPKQGRVGSSKTTKGRAKTKKPIKISEVVVNNSDNLDLVPNVSANLCVIDERGKLLEGELTKATQHMINQDYFNISYGDDLDMDVSSDNLNQELVDFAMSNAERAEDGRLILPLLWNGQVSHLLGSNRGLAEKILKSNFKKLKHSREKLLMVDQSIKEWEEMGIVERILDLDSYLQDHPKHSFLAHMGVFKMDRESTRCRLVFLSNISETKKGVKTLSHNQAMYPGPCLNKKLSASFFSLRFDDYLMIYDLKKAFLQILLNASDQDRLLFLWYTNVSKDNFQIVGYKSLRLPFGLVCSPFLLMIALYKLLIADAEDDDLKGFKEALYDLFYVDNGAFTTNSPDRLTWAYQNLEGVFAPYKFAVQQLSTNCLPLQAQIDSDQQVDTEPVVKLFGHFWNREDDTIFSKKLYLDDQADTKRKILSSLASNYDIFNLNAPLLNRARLFLHQIQMDSTVDWDTILGEKEINEWKNISRQVNNAEVLPIPRCIGRREDSYRLICFTDSSKLLYGCVLYIQSLTTLKVSFVCSKNRIVNKNLECKTIPNLELQAVTLGVESLFEVYNDVSSSDSVRPIKIESMFLFTDSLITLNWLNSFNHKLDNVQKRSVFAINHLCRISKLCEQLPVNFNFIAGEENPADLVTRNISFKQLKRSSFFTGPKFLVEAEDIAIGSPITVVVPNPLSNIGPLTEPRSEAVSEVSDVSSEIINEVTAAGLTKFNGDSPVSDTAVLVGVCAPAVKAADAKIDNDCVIDIESFSSLSKAVSITKYVFQFINNLKRKLKTKNPNQFDHLQVLDAENLKGAAMLYLVKCEQKLFFSDVYNYFANPNKPLKDIPEVITRFNVFLDDKNNIRLKAKLNRGKRLDSSYPLFLPKHSWLTRLVIIDIHHRLLHEGIYAILKTLRKEFYVQHAFSVVKKNLKDCVICRRTNGRTIKLNASPYREFRLEPSEVPFRNIFLDHFGPYKVKLNNQTQKVWVLCITCLFSRAINLVICRDMTTKSFLMALQLHILEHGVPALCLSDMGSQLVPGANIVQDMLKDVESRTFLENSGIHNVKFTQYFKGHHPLGGLIETCVKMARKMMYGALQNNVLDYFAFDYLVKECIHLLNRRPVALKESLRDVDLDVPEAITPEMLLKGYETTTVNIIPELLRIDDDYTIDQPPQFDTALSKLNKVRKNLIERYHGEFLTNLISQAVDSSKRYRPVTHYPLKEGDIVLLKDPLLKFPQYPMGKVIKVQVNQEGEVTGVTIFKGKTREIVNRHVSSIIPLLRDSEVEESIEGNEVTEQTEDNLNSSTDGTSISANTESDGSTRPKRKAAIAALNKLKNWSDPALI